MGLFDLLKKLAKHLEEPFYENKELSYKELNGKWGYNDKNGKEVVPFKYDSANLFSEGLAHVRLNGKYGYIDKTGKEVIPLKYDYAGPFSEGLSLVKLNDKYGYIDKTGKEVVPLKYDNARPFSDGLADVRLNEDRFKIDKDGNRYPPLSPPVPSSAADSAGNTADIVNHLVLLYKSSPRGEGFTFDSSAAEPVKQIGKILNEAGGFELMLFVHQQFAATYPVMGAARNLEHLWDGIGSWRG